MHASLAIAPVYIPKSRGLDTLLFKIGVVEGVKSILLILALSVGPYLSAQGFSIEEEKELFELYTDIQEAESDSLKMERNALFLERLQRSLYSPGAYDHPFESLRMCKMKSPDDAFRIFNWNVPMDDGSEHYFGLLMTYDRKKEMATVIELHDASEGIDSPENKQLDEGRWYGALYYDIVPFKKSGKKRYLLLGWDGFSSTINRKVVDVLELGRKGLRFGAPVFKGEDGTQRRLLFSYAEEMTMTLQYQPKEKRLILDHLAPKNQSLDGQYQFYVPSMTFDAFDYKKGRWTYAENVEFLRRRLEKDRDFKDPRK